MRRNAESGAEDLSQKHGVKRMKMDFFLMFLTPRPVRPNSMQMSEATKVRAGPEPIETFGELLTYLRAKKGPLARRPVDAAVVAMVQLVYGGVAFGAVH